MVKKRPLHRPKDFGLEILSGDDDMFRWFLLVYLLGKPIQSSVAVNTWRIFIDQNIDTPWAIMELNESQLSKILRAGKYTRYQHVTTRALLTCMDQLVRGYEGSLMYMLEISRNQDELSKQLQKLYGVGPKTAEIFMRETEEYFARRTE